MKTILAVLLCSSMAFAQPADAPVVDPVYGFIKDLPPPGRVMDVAAGNLVPFDATCYDANQNTRNAKVSAYFEGESKDLQKGNVTISAPVWWSVIGGGITALITAISLGIVIAVQPKKP